MDYPLKTNFYFHDATVFPTIMVFFQVLHTRVDRIPTFGRP